MRAYAREMNLHVNRKCILFFFSGGGGGGRIVEFLLSLLFDSPLSYLAGILV